MPYTSRSHYSRNCNTQSYQQNNQNYFVSAHVPTGCFASPRFLPQIRQYWDATESLDGDCTDKETYCACPKIFGQQSLKYGSNFRIAFCSYFVCLTIGRSSIFQLFCPANSLSISSASFGCLMSKRILFKLISSRAIGSARR